MDEDAELDAQIAAARDQHGDIAPPWAKHPEYTRYTIGWRMGAGETWMALWRRFLERLPAPLDRIAYLRRHPKAPRTWATLVCGLLDPARQYDAPLTGDELRALRSLGLVGDDVAFDAWRAGGDASIPAIWSRSERPAHAARYNPRGLGFWTRWAATQRAGDPRFLDRWGVIPSSWAAFVVALAAGEVGDTVASRAAAQRLELAPRWPAPSEGLERLAVELAAHGGAPSTPWQLGVDPTTRAGSDALDMGYVDAWLLWVRSSFDDPRTWVRYTSGRGPLSSAWIAMLLPQFAWDAATRPRGS